MLQETMFVGSRHSVEHVASMYDKLVAVVEVDSSTWRIIWDDGKEIPLSERLATIRQQRLSAEANASTLANINEAANKKRKTAYGRKWEYVKYDCQ